MMTLQDRKKMFSLGNQLAKNVIPLRHLAPRENRGHNGKDAPSSYKTARNVIFKKPIKKRAHS